eukprot:2382412-Rhodomonas_salina.1
MSPEVLMILICTPSPSLPNSSGNAAASRLRVSYACAKAKGEPRVPSRITGSMSMVRRIPLTALLRTGSPALGAKAAAWPAKASKASVGKTLYISPR